MKIYLKKITYAIRVFFESFLAFLFLYLIVALYGAIIPVGHLNKKGDMHIYVQSNGIHTDVCLPACNEDMNWLEFLSPEAYAKNCSYEFITIGWGDKGFFLDTPTWADLKASTAINAAFLPSNTAMHVKYSEEPKMNSERKKVFLHHRDYKKMVAFIKSSFSLKNNQVQLIEGKGYSYDDNFYEAHESYHLYRTCNRWTNKALKEANIRTGVFALFPNGIISHL